MDQREVAESYFDEGRYQEALQIYTSLAEVGDVDSQVFLGWMYQNGLGIKQNMEQALVFYEQAAKLGSAEGGFYLGRLYELQNKFSEAIEWLIFSAEKNYTPAMYRLGKLYETGHPDRNISKAIGYLEEAGRRGHLLAQKDIALKMLKGQFGLAKILKGFVSLPIIIIEIYKMAKDDPYDECIRR